MLLLRAPPSLVSFSLLITLLLSSSPSQSKKHPLLPPDAAALLDFKLKADPQNTSLWRFNPFSLSHCHWPGVQCSPGSSRVSRLVLEDNPLDHGAFSPGSLTRLDQLRVLSLRNNSLSGPIPDLSGLANLKALFLHQNRFTGPFPSSLLSLHRLRTLDLSHNNLTGPLPPRLGRLDRVYCLKLESNRFVGRVPAFNQSTLLVLNVSGNNLSGPVPVTPVLSRFGPASFSHNPLLCGEIVHRECHLEKPFFHRRAPSPPSPPGPSPPKVGDELRGVELSEPSRSSHRRAAVILGFSAGVVLLIGSVICFGMAVRKQRRESRMGEEAMASDYMAAADAADVMRTEEEREEKVKSAQQQQLKMAGKSGNLVFCAGEAQLYTLEQLMRGSAELLGRGTVGTTYKAVLDNRLIVCVKRVDSSRIGGEGREVFERHMESVGALRHPNLVPLRAFFQAKEERLLVYDYQPNGSLFSLIHGSKSAKAKPLHWTSCLKIAEDVAQGLSYIHQAWRLVHGNLKASNVLLGPDFEACVTDYCLSVLTEPSPSLAESDPNSFGYKAPETRKPGAQATSKSDVYAFGVLLLELLTGKPPSEHPYLTPKDVVQWVKTARDVDDGGRDESRLAMLLEVAIACSMASPEQRPNMWQVLKMLQEIKEAVLMEENGDLDNDDGMP